MSVYIKPCLRCRRTPKKKKDGRKRKACPDCRWITMAPPSMARRSLGVFVIKELAEKAERDALQARDHGFDLITWRQRSAGSRVEAQTCAHRVYGHVVAGASEAMMHRVGEALSRVQAKLAVSKNGAG